MRNVKLNCTVVCDYKPTLDLQGQEVNLNKQGKTATGSITVAVGDDQFVQIHIYVAGIEGEKWSLDIKMDCPNGTPTDFYSDSGLMPQGGDYEYYLKHRVPLSPCIDPATKLADQANEFDTDEENL